MIEWKYAEKISLAGLVIDRAGDEPDWIWLGMERLIVWIGQRKWG